MVPGKYACLWLLFLSVTNAIRVIFFVRSFVCQLKDILQWEMVLLSWHNNTNEQHEFVRFLNESSPRKIAHNAVYNNE